MTLPAERPDIAAIVQAEHGDPFAVLGMHETSGTLVVRTFRPSASAVQVVDTQTGAAVADLNQVHPAGVFEGPVPGRRQPFAYKLRVHHPGGVADIDDPYAFPPVLGELDMHLLVEGKHLRNYERMGAHPTEMNGVAGTSFAVWAPSARRVAVVGDFNGWDGRIHPMRLRIEAGVWEIFLPGVAAGARYKFEIKGPGGEMMPLKADPYAFYAERPSNTASIVHGSTESDWQDGAWMASRAGVHSVEAPISIYEVHTASWRRGEDNRYLTYDELADELVPYVRDMGFTHIELMPISEFPFDGSWGYQPIGLYAPTSRHGSPEQFQRFVDRCHREGIGLLLDWVPGHFPTDPHGLGYFDGTHLYEHADPRQGFHMDWNTLIYNYGRVEVANYLLGNALFWMDRYHLDGLRVDAVASMLYLDYSREAGQWIPNRFGGRENLEAVDLLKRMNEEVYSQHPGAMTVAEESTAWPGVSRPTYTGGLGFGYKWNMGWMHDTLEFMSNDPVHRRYHHHEMTFGLLYAYSENFILPLSHDEVVHGKGSLLGKMPGDDWQKFANLRAYYGFMWSHPGKKLLFMGCEFAQRQEWNHNYSLDWHLLEDHMHRGMQGLVRDLNRLYRETPSLHRHDCAPEGFDWVGPQDIENSVLAYIRRGNEDDPPVLVLCNFTPVPREHYRVGVPVGGRWREVMNTDAGAYGGSNMGNGGGVEADAVEAHGRPHSLSLTLPPLATIMLQPE